MDLPPEELRARLAAGKVYLPESARAAREHYFRPGNLSALRELALRFAAEHVGQDVLAYRQALGIADPWKSGQRLLVRWTRRLVLLCYVLTYLSGLPRCPHAMEPKAMAAQPGSVS